MVEFLQYTLNGISTAAIYSLIALGFSLIYKVSHALNLAQGGFYALTAFIAYTFLAAQFNLLTALFLSLVMVTILGLLMEWIVIRPAASGANLSVLLMLTLGVSMIFQGSMKLIWGTDPVALPSFSNNVSLSIFGASLLLQNLIVVIGTVVIVLALYFFIRSTNLGKSMTAVAENPYAAGVMGISSNAVRSFAFAISALIGALGGVLASPITLVTYQSGTIIGFHGYTAAVLGGVSHVFGGIIGSLTLGLAEAYSSGYISSLFQDTTTFLILILVLVFRSFRQQGKEIGQSRSVNFGSPLSVDVGMKGKFLLALLLLIAIVFPFTTHNYYFIGVATVIFIFMIAVLGLDLLLGFTGILSLGQSGFMAIAGYTFAILVRDAGINIILAFLAAMVASLLVAWILAVSTIRLTGYNIAIATLGFSVIIANLAIGFRDLTGGSAGLTGIPILELASITIGPGLPLYLFVLAIVVLGYILAYNIVRSKAGRVLKSIKQDPLAASSMGVDVSAYKIKMFVISSGYAAMAGILYAVYMSFLSPDMVGMDTSFLLLIMLTLGGTGSLWGVIPGVIIIELIPEFFSGIADYQSIFEGLILILVLIFFKGGIWSLIGRLKKWPLSKPLPMESGSTDKHE